MEIVIDATKAYDIITEEVSHLHYDNDERGIMPVIDMFMQLNGFIAEHRWNQ